MDNLSEDDNEPGKLLSSTETQEIKAEVTMRDSLDNATKLQTDNSIDLLTASFESTEEKQEPHILVSEKIRRLFSLPLPADIAFTEASLTTIRRFAEEENLDTLIIGVAGDQLIATFSSEELPQAVTNISFIVKQKCEILGVDDFISKVTHFSLPMDAKSGSLHLMQSTFAHNFIFDEHAWPETMKNKLTSQLHEYFMMVGDENHAEKSLTYLYVPIENLNGDVSELIGQIEEAVSRWYEQVTVSVNAEDLDMKLPKMTDLVNFWENKYKNINFLEVQLRSKAIQKMLNVLMQENSYSATKLQEIIAKTACAKLEAKCCKEQISQLRPLSDKLVACNSFSDASSIIVDTLVQIKDLWQHSSYFREKNRVSKILACLGNQVIELCSKTVQLKSLFRGKPVLGISKVQEAVENCKTFIAAFQQQFSKSAAMKLCDPKELFSTIFAFMNRCNDLKEIFDAVRIFARIDESKQVFSPSFGGANGMYFEEWSERIKSETLAAVREIGAHKTIALDVSSTEWQHQMEIFNEKIAAVERKVEALVRMVMDDVSNIYEGLNGLQQLLHYFQRTTFEPLLKEQSSMLYGMLLKEVEKATRNLLGGRLIGYSGFPPYSGSALMAHNSRSYLVGQMLLLEQSKFLPECEVEALVTKELAFYVSVIDETIQELFDRWMVDLPIDWELKLRRPLIAYHPAYEQLIEPTLGRDIFETIEEIRVWKSLGFEAPEKMRELYALETSLGHLKDDVQIICHQFNEAMQCIQCEDFNLFDDYLVRVKQDLKPAMFAYNWTSKAVEEYLDRRIQSTLKLKILARELNSRKSTIGDLCHAIAKSQILEINSTELYNFDVAKTNFEMVITCNFEKIQECFNTLRDQFGNMTAEVQRYWKSFYRKISDVIDESIVAILRNSFRLLLKIFREAPFYTTIKASLEDRKIVFDNMLSDFQNKIDQSFAFHLSLAKSVPRVGKLTTGQKTLEQKIIEDTVCKELRTAITAEQQTLAGEVKKFSEKLKTFKWLWEISTDEFLQNYQQQKLSPAEISSDIERFSTLLEEADVPSTATVAFIKLDAAAVKNKFAQLARTWRAAMINFVLNSALVIARKLNKTMLDDIEKLSHDPQTLQEVAEKTVYCQFTMGHVPIIESQLRTLNDYCDILKNYKVTFPNELTQLLHATNNGWKKYTQVLEEAKNSLEKSKDKFRTSMIEKGNALSRDLSKLCARVHQEGPFNSDWNEKEAFKFLVDVKLSLIKLHSEKEHLSGDFEIFGVDPPQLAEIQNMEKTIAMLKDVWAIRKEWMQCNELYLNTLFIELQVGDIQTKIEEISEILRSLSDGPAREWQILEQTRAEVETLKHGLPVVCKLRASALRDRHWMQIQKIIKKDFDANSDDFTLKYLLALGTSNYEDDIRVVCSQAQEEECIEKGLSELELDWKNEKLPMTQCTETDSEIFSGTGAALTKIDTSLDKLAGMEASASVSAFVSEINSWQCKVGKLLSFLTHLIDVQFKLVSFNPSKALREELITKNAAVEINEDWKELSDAHKNSTDLFSFSSEYNLQKLNAINKHLDTCESTVRKFIEEKVQEAPRLYFLSTNEQRNLFLNPSFNGENYQVLIPKCFPGIQKLKLGRLNNEVLGMCTPCGEVLLFTDSVRLNEGIPDDIRMLEEQLKEVLQTLQARCCAGLLKNPTKSERWLRAFPGQTCVLAAQAFWTNELLKNLEKCNKNETRKPLKQMFQDQESVISRLISNLAGSLSAVDRVKMTSFLTMEIFLNAKTEEFTKSVYIDPASIEIMSLLKYFWNDDELEFTVQQMFSTFKYAYQRFEDYQLPVLTPSLEKSVMHMTTAMSLNMALTMQGPTQCGKFETVNALAKLLGRLFVVFCCNQTTKINTFTAALLAVAKMGAFGMFKDYLSLPPSTLQEVSYHLAKFVTAKALNHTSTAFHEQELLINPDTAIFLSIRKHDKNEAILPASLRSQFRPVAMTSLNFHAILEILLLGQGFVDARSLSLKLTQLETLCKAHLSDRSLWIFDSPRILLKIAQMAIQLKQSRPTVSEEEAMLYAAVANVEPQLDKSDLKVFKHYAALIFPGIELIRVENNDLKAALIAVYGDEDLEPLEYQIENCLKIFTMLHDNKSVIICGNCWSGKTTSIRMLVKALQKSKTPGFSTIKLHHIYPSTLKLDQIFGYEEQGKWEHGVLQRTLKDIQSDQATKSHWIYFDGAVHESWVSILQRATNATYTNFAGDDELSLAHPNIKLIFEVDKLNSVSPGLLSGCASIFFDDEVGWTSIVHPQLDKIEEGPLKLELKLLVTESLQRCFQFKRERCKEAYAQHEMAGAQNFCTILKCLVNSFKRSGVERESILMAKNVFYFSIVWGIFGSIEEESYTIVDSFIRELEPGIFPKTGLVFDYFVDSKRKKFVHWKTQLPKIWRYDPTAAFHEINVPTVAVAKYKYLLDIFVKGKRPLLLSGRIGTGKSFICDHVLKSLNSTTYYSKHISATNQTDNFDITGAVTSNLQPRSNYYQSHRKEKSLVLLLQDINLMTIGANKNEPALEILRQWLDHGFWINKSLCPQYVKDIHLVASMSHRGIDANLHERLKSKFATLNVPMLTNTELVHIFGSILNQHLLNFGEHIKVLGTLLVEATVELHALLKQCLIATLDTPQCVFSLKTLSQVIQGLLLSNRDHHNTQHAMCKLWINEVFLAYGARLCDKSQKDTLHRELIYKMNSKLNITFEELYPGKITPPIIGMYSNKEGEVNCPIEFTMESARGRMEQLVEEFKRSKPLQHRNLLVLDETVHFVTKMVRILSQSSHHNMILIGEAGCGRKCLVEFSAFVCGLTYVQPDLKNISLPSSDAFKAFWKNIIQRATFDDEKIVLLYEDSLILYSKAIESINSVIENGQIVNLFHLEEIEDMSEKFGCDAESLMMERMRRNVRHVVSLPPCNHQLRSVLYNFPALLKCNMVIFGEWSYEKIFQSCQQFLKKLPDQSMEKEKLAICFAKFYSALLQEIKKSCWKIAVTPKHLFECLITYANTLKQHQGDIEKERDLIFGAFNKMSASSKKLAELSANLLQAQRKVVESQRQCETALVNLGQRKREVEEQKTMHEKKLQQIEQEEVSIQQLARLAHQAMDEAIPCLEDADMALESIESSDLQVLRSYGRPPPLIEMVTSAVLLMKQADPTWAEVKRQLADPNFTEQLINFEKDRIPEKTLKAVASITNNEEFNLEKIETLSTGAKLLAQWVIAMEKYGKVYRAAAPKRSKLERASKELREHQAKLADIFSKMTSLQNQLEKQKEVHKKCLEDKKLLDAKVEEMAVELQRANDLLTSLSKEEQEWSSFIDNYDTYFKSLYGDCIFLAVRQVYLGPLKLDERKKMKDQLNSIMSELKIESGNYSSGKQTIDLLIRAWLTNGLHEDEYLKESAQIVLETSIATAEPGDNRPTLIYDPQGLGKLWLKRILKQEIVEISHSDNELERLTNEAKQRGSIIFIEDVNVTLRPTVARLLKSLNAEPIKLEPVADHNAKNQIYFFSIMENCKEKVELTTNLNFVQFSCQLEGLKNHLLGTFVAKDNPAMAAERASVSKMIFEGSQSADRLHKKLIQTILNCGDTILDDTSVMSDLESTKLELNKVENDLAYSLVSEKSLEQQRELFASSCEKSASFYLMLMELKNLHATYNIPLKSFVATFESSISLKIAQNLSPKQRVDFVMEHAENVYQTYFSRIMAQHKLTFSLQLCLKVMENYGNPFPSQFLEFIIENLKLPVEQLEINRKHDWLTNAAYDNLGKLANTSNVFTNLQDDVASNQDAWHSWLQSDEPEKLPLPDAYQELDPASKLVLVAALRPDRLLTCLEKFICGEVGEQFVEKCELDLATIVEESPPSAPIIIIAEEKIDVVTALDSLGRLVGVNVRLLFNIGHAKNASSTICGAGDRGDWVVVYCPNDEMSVELSSAVFTKTKLSPSFRLFIILSTSACVDIQYFAWDRGTLFTIDKTTSIKDTMQRLLQHMQAKDQSQNSVQVIWNMALLHTCISGKQMLKIFAKDYDFKDSDFSVACKLLRNFAYSEQTELMRREYLEWIVECAYLCHTTNEVDYRIIDNLSNEIIWEHAFSAITGENSLQLALTEDGRLFSTGSLPSEVSQSAFSMVVNTSYGTDLLKSDYFLMTLRKIHCKSKNHSTLQKITSIKGSLKSIGDFFKTMQELKIREPEKTDVRWTAVKCHLEVERAQLNARELNILRLRCDELHTVIQGKLLFSETIARAAAEISRGKLPQQWMRDYFQKDMGSQDLISVLKMLEIKADTIFRLRKNLNEFIPPITMGAFKKQRSLLSALRQDICHHFSDVFNVSWTFTIALPQEDVHETSDEIILNGIWLRGALWDHENGFLLEPSNFADSCRMPSIYMKPSSFVFASDYQEYYMCPLYADESSTNEPLLMIPLHPGAKQEEHWTRQGVALHCRSA